MPAATVPIPHSSASHPPASPADRSATACRSAETSSDSSLVRPGASPCQNGTDGGAPCASTTRTVPGSTRRIRQEWVPSRKTSPGLLSTAHSSCTDPTCISSGSAMTRKSPSSGMAPPEVSAASRAPRRAFTVPLIWSLCR
jgi:hypothetical protein